MTHPVTAQDRERGEEDSVLSLLRIIYRIADNELGEPTCAEVAFLAIRGCAAQAIAQIDSMSTLDGQRSYALGIEEKRKELNRDRPELMNMLADDITVSREELSLALEGEPAGQISRAELEQQERSTK